MTKWLLIFKDTETSLHLSAADAQTYFDEWPDDSQVLVLKGDGTWSDVTDEFSDEYATRSKYYRDCAADARSTYYGSVL